MASTVTDVQQELGALAGRSVEASEFSDHVATAIRHVLPYDGWCLFGLDPDSGLRTVQFGGRGTEHTAEMAHNEASMTDVNRYRELFASEQPAGWLSTGHPQARHSFRLHEILLPQGMSSEIRLALREDGRLWGGLTLFREHERRPFDDHDVNAVCALAPALVRALRAYPVRALSGRGESPGSGVVALAPDNRLVAVSAPAQAWLEDLVPGGDDETYVTDVTRVLFDAAHALRRGETDRASTCVRTVSGHWLRVEGTALSLGEADVVVVLQGATVQQLLRTIALYNRLTIRESQILDLVGHGLPAKLIARELAISVLTVSCHLRSLYRKCGVTGREELLGRLV